ncbi:MAG: aminoacyl-tRNA hydrolase [Alphaproteobacteria bacterium]|nr:aminoacyl-tRNA hydrolase [Alphaproteobacteria bacterium]
MRLLVGLGNPGTEYAATRHNMGFMAVDAIVHRFSFSDWKKSCKGLIAKGEIAGEKIVILKPETYMNLSGESVLAALSFYKLTPKDVVVFHDDLALPVGKVKVKTSGSAGGHNGVKNIDTHIGPDYMRVRIGVDQNHAIDTVDYVLGKPSPDEQKVLAETIQKIANNMELLIQGDDQTFMNRLVG